jgi:hypothetical protein
MTAHRIGVWVVSAALGASVGAMLHLALYRIGLPVHPFIYQAF